MTGLTKLLRGITIFAIKKAKKTKDILDNYSYLYITFTSNKIEISKYN